MSVNLEKPVDAVISPGVPCKPGIPSLGEQSKQPLVGAIAWANADTPELGPDAIIPFEYTAIAPPASPSNRPVSVVLPPRASAGSSPEGRLPATPTVHVITSRVTTAATPNADTPRSSPSTALRSNQGGDTTAHKSFPTPTSKTPPAPKESSSSPNDGAVGNTPVRAITPSGAQSNVLINRRHPELPASRPILKPEDFVHQYNRIPNSKELAADINREAALLEKPLEETEMNDYFWICNIKKLKVALHVAIFFLYIDALGIISSFRNEYLLFQLLFVIPIIGLPFFIFGVTSENHYNFAFIFGYVSCASRFLINGFLIFHYWTCIGKQQQRAAAYNAFLNTVHKTPSLGDKPPLRDSTMFRSPIIFYIIMGFCGFMMLMQVWTVAVVIPKAQSWMKKRNSKPRSAPNEANAQNK